MEFWVGFAFHLGLWGFFVDFWCFGGFFEEGVVWFGFWGFFYKVLSCSFESLFHDRFFYKEGQESKEMNEHCL